MSKSYFTAMVVLLLIGLTSISSVAGLKCYSCFGPEDCSNSKIGEQIQCEAAQFTAACRQDTYIEGGMGYKKGEVLSRFCSYHEGKGSDSCTTIVGRKKKDDITLERCDCWTDMCNDGSPRSQRDSLRHLFIQSSANGHHHHPLLLFAASVLTSVLISSASKLL